MQQTEIDANFRHVRKAGALLALCIALRPAASFAATAEALLPRNLSPWGMFVNADIVVKAVMVGLAFASLVTWTVWLSKTIEIRRATASAKRRLGVLASDTRLADVERDSRAGSRRRRADRPVGCA